MDRSALKCRRIAVGVGGGIAAYKACELVRDLAKAGAEVRVAMTPAATQFVTPLTLQNLSHGPVLTDYFDPSQENMFGHLRLSRWAELYVVAPATADLLARIRAGMANDAVTTSLLAFTGPVVLAPAMNVFMWQNRLTQENVKALAQEPRYHFVGPASGELADGDVGPGRLADVPDITDACARLFAKPDLAGRRVLVTAGPTREWIDPVRFISNPSTGKMGLALAQEARSRGADVTVVLGPVQLPSDERRGLNIVDVITAEDMAKAVLARVNDADVFIATAAVSDYRPEQIAKQKLKKSERDEQLTLTRTPDVLLEASKQVHARDRRPLLVGFAAETEHVEAHAQEKLQKKKLDLIVANDVTKQGVGFGVETNTVVCLSKDGGRTELTGSKRSVAAGIWDLLVRYPAAASARSDSDGSDDKSASGSSGKRKRP